MPDLPEYPMGLIGVEFIEFASPMPGMLETVFEGLGFARLAVHRSKDIVLYRQGDINFIVNNEPDSVATYFAAEQGPSACGLAFRVKDARAAYSYALAAGAAPIEGCAVPVDAGLPALQGIGGAPLYLIDHVGGGNAIYDVDFEFLDGVALRPPGHGLKLIDHLTHHVYGGCLSYWAVLYERLFSTKTMRYLDIMSGHETRAWRALVDDHVAGTLQCEGIQHIAFLTENLIDTVDRLRAAGVPLMSAPGVDGVPRVLLQVGAGPWCRPVLFEFMQREDAQPFERI